jgi:hypothetical protein
MYYLAIKIQLTLNLLTTTIVAPPSNASKWQMGFNSALKGLMKVHGGTIKYALNNFTSVDHKYKLLTWTLLNKKSVTLVISTIILI